MPPSMAGPSLVWQPPPPRRPPRRGGGCLAALGPHAAPLAVACLPLWGPSWEGAPANPASEQLEGSSRTLGLKIRLVGICAATTSAAFLEILLGDPLSGLIDSLISALGVTGSAPEGSRYLSSYVVLGVANGTMRVLLGFDFASRAGVLRAFLAPVLAGKLVPLVAVASPVLMFAGVWTATRLQQERRGMHALAAAGVVLPGAPAA
ncbi:unnamed protein product, partial [Prorocentrum cordatum]